MNKVILSGNISQKRELKVTDKKLSIMNMTLATNEKYKDSEGTLKQNTDYHEITLFGKIAEMANKNILVGTSLVIEGHLNYSEYEKEGQKHKRASIVVEKLEFIGAKKTIAKKEENKPAKAKAGDKCTSCGNGELVERKSKAGSTFLGCSNYPNCKFIAK